MIIIEPDFIESKDHNELCSLRSSHGIGNEFLVLLGTAAVPVQKTEEGEPSLSVALNFPFSSS